jgi:ubiquinone/menaquinone biosynthesis C-methylase UbiE
MKRLDFHLKDVRDLYTGPVGTLWELIMGEQIHVGGLRSSVALAEKARVRDGMRGVDLCCALGAGMRFLAKTYGLAMWGVDGTPAMLEKARARAAAEGLAGKLEFILGDVTRVDAPDASFDLVWGEDAWCYVDDKDTLIGEAARLLRPGGTLAFTDWIEGPAGLSEEEAARINAFMVFPYMESLEGYRRLMEKHGLRVDAAEDLTPEFSRYCALYLRMLDEQLTYDALRILGNDHDAFQGMAAEMTFMTEKAAEGKAGRGRFVARKLP